MTLQDFTPLHTGSDDFGVIVESLGATPAQLVVERATYSSRVVLFSCGRFTCASYTPWAAGVNALSTRLQ